MLATVRVVGMKAGDREDVAAAAGEADPVLLLPEPDNPVDSRAVAVWTCPRAILAAPDELVSSARDPELRIGRIPIDDRAKLAHAGYLPADVAAGLALPGNGIVGWVARIRWAPPEYEPDGSPAPRRVAGFDVAAYLPDGVPA